jgi:general secretion pathway protein D
MLVGPLLDASLGSIGGSDGSSTISIPAFGFTLQALQSNSDVNILQTPHILTTDNEEAEIEVGRKVPFNSGVGGLGGLGSLGLGGLGGLSGLGLGGAAGGASGLGALGSLGSTLGAFSGMGTIQYADIKISLKIKPTVNESNFVRLEIEQQIDDFDGIDQRTGAPNTSNRRVKNIVVVRDQQPVVIGGLMNDREVEGVRKVPFLGDIPLLGALFRQTTTKVERKNLLMVIIPHIIDDPSDLKRIHEQRMNEIRQFAEFMATRRKEYLGELNFDKRHGILHEMHLQVERARTERYQLEQQLFDGSELDPVGPAETHDLDYDPYEIETRRQRRGKGTTPDRPSTVVNPVMENR